MPFLSDADPLLVLAAVLVAGVLFGWLARSIRLPSVTGQIIAGVAIGPAGLALFDVSAVHGLQPLTHFALGLMAVTVGGHLNVRRLRNAGKRLFLLLLLESLVTPLVVFSSLVFLPGIEWSTALLFAMLAISTAPATIIALVKETRAKGVFVKTLIAAVAFNNMACIVLFELARVAAHVHLEEGGALNGNDVWMAPALQLVQAAAIGGGAALVMEWISRAVSRSEVRTTAAVVILLLTCGAAAQFEVSPLLACLMLGLIQTNFTRTREHLLDSFFAEFEPAILAVFFTLAGTELSFEHIGAAGLVATVFFAARFVGKIGSATWAMHLAGAPERVRRNLGFALIPQAGVAVGLVLLLQEDAVFRDRAADTLALFVGVVLTAVTVNEIVGPILTRFALARAGEVGKDRMRLIDFIHEENIVVGLDVDTMEQAIEHLVDLLVRSHRLEGVDSAELLQSVLDREAQVSTCLGGGLAVPHGILPAGRRMVGVMGLNRDGLPFDTPDGRKVHCVVLLATPGNERDRHLQVLATLARTLGTDPVMQAQLFNAKSPAHAYEMLHDEEAEDFNYFLED